jgi:hypothetical protein
MTPAQVVKRQAEGVMDDAVRRRNGDLSDGDAAEVGRLILSAQRMASELLADARRQVADTTVISGKVAVLTGPSPDPSFVARLEEIERRTEEAARELARAEARSIEHLERLQQLLARQRRALEDERADLEGSAGLAQVPLPDPFAVIESWSSEDSLTDFSGLHVPVESDQAGADSLPGGMPNTDTMSFVEAEPSVETGPSADTVSSVDAASRGTAEPASAGEPLSEHRAHGGDGSVWAHRLLTGGAGIAILAAAIEVARVL